MTVTALHPAAPALPPTVEIEPAPLIRTAYEPAPAGTPADLPRVFQVIHGVMRDVMPVGKDQQNTQQNYQFRGVDDAMSAMAGPMRNHGCFIAPEIASHNQRPRGEKGTHTVIKMLYRIYGPAGDCLHVTVPGEAMDTADKSTNKAMSAALKYMLFQVFMIPVDARSIDDSDRDNPTPPTEHRAERQRNQQRRQRGQQRQQHSRPSDRSEPDQWEQRPAQNQQQGPRTDYLAHAERAGTPEQFDKIRAAAANAGAPADYLAKLDAIAARKRETSQQGQQGAGQTPQQGERPAPPANPPKSPEAAAADAENALRLAASRANLPTLDADFERVYGLPIAQAGAQQIDAFRALIENGGAR
ncbi:ERF family protein [Streptomyces sp. 8L]|uniref:ERF family protein n=1 Tax=Streptomyces sp. 8L TaxID=2877242 RepID=UPI001CD442C7|nr:ERF family protein [Streptomyces sp. 8L]MCA1218864.1 ERF family protein [Streptomyces sp. 8L]